MRLARLIDDLLVRPDQTVEDDAFKVRKMQNNKYEDGLSFVLLDLDCTSTAMKKVRRSGQWMVYSREDIEGCGLTLDLVNSDRTCHAIAYKNAKHTEIDLPTRTCLSKKGQKM